ncbi:hypothetical protein ACVWZ4_001013 [Bradyrhizobium sp. USDA 4472]
MPASSGTVGPIDIKLIIVAHADNAPMESFFHTLRTERVHHRQYQTRTEAQHDILAFIEGFYNRTRLHSAIGYIPPIQMELKLLNPVHFFGGRSFPGSLPSFRCYSGLHALRVDPKQNT